MKKGDKAWKVVERETRFGTNLIHYRKRSGNAELLRLGKQYPKLFPQYIKGNVLEAEKWTKGYFVFRYKEHCIDFIFLESLPEKNVEIIRVQLLDTPKYLYSIIPGCGEYPLFVYESKQCPSKWNTFPAPRGTWVCHKIKVLD